MVMGNCITKMEVFLFPNSRMASLLKIFFSLEMTELIAKEKLLRIILLHNAPINKRSFKLEEKLKMA